MVTIAAKGKILTDSQRTALENFAWILKHANSE